MNKLMVKNMKMNKKKFYAVLVISALFLTGCGEPDHSDLKNWIKSQEQTVRGKVEPLPRSLDYMAIPFEGAPTIDPFKVKQLGINAEGNKENKNQTQPEVNRRKEPLESFNLSELKVMGFFTKDGKAYALVRTSRDNVVHSVTIGNYMGTNFGKVIKIENDTITLREILYQGDEWIEKNIDISPLAEPNVAKTTKNK